MKNQSIAASFLFGAIVFALTAIGSATSALAGALMPPLLVVDVSSPSAVSFTATGGTPSFNDSSTTIVDGVTLLSFFTDSASVFGDALPNPTLTPDGATMPYDGVINEYDSVGDRDLNLFRFGQLGVPSETQMFDVNRPAFAGVLVADLSGLPLPAPGTTGPIFAGDDYTLPPPPPVAGSLSLEANGVYSLPIGTYVVVPEPSAMLYGGVVSLLAGCFYRLRPCSRVKE